MGFGVWVLGVRVRVLCRASVKRGWGSHLGNFQGPPTRVRLSEVLAVHLAGERAPPRELHHDPEGLIGLQATVFRLSAGTGGGKYGPAAPSAVDSLTRFTTVVQHDLVFHRLGMQ